MCLNREYKLSPTLLGCVRRFSADTGGATAVIAAVLFPVVVGGLGLGAETGYWYLSQRKLQHAVDVSVHAAGARLRAADPEVEIVAAARHVASSSGLPASSLLTVNIPPESGAYAGDPKSVEVIATDTQPRLFSSVFNDEPVDLGGRAVARVTHDADTVACVLALSPTAPRAVTMDGSSSINLDGCDIASNSNAGDSLYATSAISTGCAYTVGEAVTTSGLTLTNCPEVKEYAPLIRDPYAEVDEPVSWSDCDSSKQGHPTSPSPALTPRCFSGGLTVKGELHFEPGLYIIDGGEFSVNSGDNAKLTGEGVTFYLANGARLNIGGSIQMNFTAPTDGPYSGILFFGDRSATATSHTLAGNSASDYTGAVYTPASKLTFAGSSKSGSEGCTQIIGDQVIFTGNSSLRSSCDLSGTSDIETNEVVKIVE